MGTTDDASRVGHEPGGVARVRTAVRPGGDRLEDRIFTGRNFVVVLDGASQPDGAERDGGWIAERLGNELQRRLDVDHQATLRGVLEEAIREVGERHGLLPGKSPSTTASIVRWTATTVDVLVLCDSPVVVAASSGTLHHVRDDRIRRLASQLPSPAGFYDQDVDTWRRRAGELRQRRNRPGGYWVAEADPAAAEHAVSATFPLSDVVTVLVMTDGVSAGVDDYDVPGSWADAVGLACHDPASLVDVVHAAEEKDPEGSTWPRPKRHDDKALAVITFSDGGTP